MRDSFYRPTFVDLWTSPGALGQGGSTELNNLIHRKYDPEILKLAVVVEHVQPVACGSPLMKNDDPGNNGTMSPTPLNSTPGDDADVRTFLL
jgi:hypothetical protein